MTQCEKLGYKVGDKFVVVNVEPYLSAAEVGDILTLRADDDTRRPYFDCGTSVEWCTPRLEDIVKLDGDGWVGWKGGEMPVDIGTLVDVVYRDGDVTLGVSAGLRPDHDGFVGGHVAGLAYRWIHIDMPGDIVAYRLHQTQRQFKGAAASDVGDAKITSCKPSEQRRATLDELLHAWQKAKTNADTSRNILKLSERDEADARKALDDALQAAGWGEDAKDEPLQITDWRDLKPGDVVWWSGRSCHGAGEYPVVCVERTDYTGSVTIGVGKIEKTGNPTAWIDVRDEQWRFIRRP